MAEESHENFSNFVPAFGLERSEAGNQNKPKSKGFEPTPLKAQDSFFFAVVDLTERHSWIVRIKLALAYSK